MKILFLCTYYTPEIAASLYLSSDLMEDLAVNHEVEIYTPVPSRGLTKKEYKKYKNQKSIEYTDRNLEIKHFMLFRENKNKVARTFRYFIQNIIQFFYALKTDADVIYIMSTPPTQGVLGALIKKIKKVPIIYNIHDIFPESLVNAGLTNKNSVVFRIGNALQLYIYKNVDKLIVLSNDMKSNLLKKNVPENKVEVVYSWVDEKKIIPITRENNKLISKYRLEPQKFFVLYAGNLGLGQDIEVIIKAAKMLVSYKDIKFLIFGTGSDENYYKTMASKMGLKNLFFFPMQPYEDVSYVYSLGDICIVSCKKGVGHSGMPSKTWSILSTGKPLIAVFDKNSELETMVKENNWGEFVEAGDYEMLSKAVLNLYDNPKLRKEIGKKNREYILNNLTRNVMTTKIENIFKEVVKI